MGKTAKGAVWLDGKRTSPLEFYQYWRNVGDADVLKCIKMLTFIPLEEIKKMESLVDKYEDKISTYLVKIAEHQVASSDSRVVTELLHCIGDLERISDHALNIAEVAQEISEKKIDFSESAKADIKVITAAVNEVLEIATAALVDENIDIAKKVEPLEQVIDRLKRKIKNGHIDRLRQGDCTMELGFILSDLLTNYERISDHCSNIAVAVIEAQHDTFDAHHYLKSVKYGDDQFKEIFEEYNGKYDLHK
jgi:phosphate:Na+ symporter